MSSVLKRDPKTPQASADVTADKLAKFLVEKVEGERADTFYLFSDAFCHFLINGCVYAVVCHRRLAVSYSTPCTPGCIVSQLRQVSMVDVRRMF